MISSLSKRMAYAFGALLIFGCGGGGGIGGPSISLSADKTTVPYGQNVTIRWSSRQITSIQTDDTNFPVVSTNLDGSFVDLPASDTTYHIEARDTQGNIQSATMTIRVAPSTKKILVLADTSVAGVPQVVDYLRTITSQPVVTSRTLPSTINADLIVISSTAQIGTAERTPIRNFLISGGRVVLVGKAAPKLATGNPDNASVAALGSWFAGATQIGFSIDAMRIVSSNPGIPISAVYYGDSISTTNSVSPLTGAAIKLSTLGDGSFYNTFVYKPAIGGRVGYTGSAPIGTSVDETAMRGAFLSVCRWALDGK